MDYTVHGLLQAQIMEWVAFPFSRESSQPRDQTQVSRIAGGFFTSWPTREAQEYWSGQPIPSPADLPDPGIELGSPALQADSLPAELPGKPPTVPRMPSVTNRHAGDAQDHSESPREKTEELHLPPREQEGGRLTSPRSAGPETSSHGASGAEPGPAGPRWAPSSQPQVTPLGGCGQRWRHVPCAGQKLRCLLPGFTCRKHCCLTPGFPRAGTVCLLLSFWSVM